MSRDEPLTDDIQRICQALDLAPSASQLSQLASYVALLERWNTTYNLTAVRERSAILTLHLADCLALIPSLERHVVGARLLDVGSGGGLPGVVVALMLPSLDVTCVDAVAKKVAFMRQVAATLRLPNLRVEHSRIERRTPDSFECITSRAFASLHDFVNSTRYQLAAGGVWVAMKGKLPSDEVAGLPAGINVFHVEPLTVPGLDAQRCLVWMRCAQTTPA